MNTKNKNNLIKNHGFSLAEVIVAAGLLGVIALGGMKIIDFQTERTRDTSKNFQADNIMYDLMFVLRDRDSCYETFKDHNTSNASLSQIVRKELSGTVTPVLVKSKEYGSLENESGVGKVKIKDLKLGNVKLIQGNLRGTSLIVT